MAQQLYQLASVQAAFAARIRAKVDGRREHAEERAADIPLLNWLIRPLTRMAFNAREGRNTRRGEHGEEAVLATLLRWLPDRWYIFHNVVVEVEPDNFAQIDLLLLSTAGMFLVETKAWRGSYKGYRDVWHQREGENWVKVGSPTAQVQRQARMLCSWLEQQRSLALPASCKERMTPLVVFIKPKWLRASHCSVEVFEGTQPLVHFLQAQPADTLTTSQIETLCDLIIRSPTPLLLPLKQQRGTDQDITEQPTPVAGANTTIPSPTSPATTSAQTVPAPTPPLCPKCSVHMVIRTARRGFNVGNRFYGCPNFPNCRSILPLEIG